MLSSFIFGVHRGFLNRLWVSESPARTPSVPPSALIAPVHSPPAARPLSPRTA
ncbi:hypothetical protein GCM10008018_68420 [Paenibacillus marchantiophytorum]|uniref:Uncharacterized protein n=1 Tax=Paenibacillus marchantiophytorum TaxID=1619310 RepID=A0ABQ1FIN0_9BACL|nr:hypothetical protein GCM10008018_68420 [Paenibacillus marchantiophytorum]